MHYTTTDFVNTAAQFLRDAVLPIVTRELDALQTAKGVAGRERLVATVTAWSDDIVAGRAESALAPAPFAHAIETLWLLSVVGVVPVGNGGRFVDVLMRPELTRAVALAAAAAGTLDLLRGSSVDETWRRRQIKLVDMMADAASNPMAGVAGSA